MNQEELARRSAEIAQSAADAAWLAAYAAALTALLSLGLLVGAFLAWNVARETLKQARAAHKQVQQDSIEQTRPYVYAQVVPGLAGIGTWDLLVTNTGRSSARNLTMVSDRWPEKDDVVTKGLKTLFSTARSLPPGARLRVFWRVGLRSPEARFGDGTRDAKGMTGAAMVTLSYTSDDPTSPQYHDSYAIDPEGMGQPPAPYRGIDVSSGLEAAQQDLHKMLAAIAENIGELRR
ncbi:hypothetical protein [Paenarthrobacter sp. NPDC089316]|uniref:hypothetical protein n=1 Tax=unclassified Paenarthrobacter TaxID=2634190 RepID=UPI00344645F1